MRCQRSRLQNEALIWSGTRVKQFLHVLISSPRIRVSVACNDSRQWRSGLESGGKLVCDDCELPTLHRRSQVNLTARFCRGLDCRACERQLLVKPNANSWK